MNFGERITRTIINAEIAGFSMVAFAGLAERLAVYIDEQDQSRFLADASVIAREPVTELDDAFCYLLPVDCNVVCGVHGITLEPWIAPAIWKESSC